MHRGKLVFAQLMEHLPLHTFRRCVARYPSRYPTLKFSHLDQFLCMAFAQLTFRESLRDQRIPLCAEFTDCKFTSPLRRVKFYDATNDKLLVLSYQAFPSERC
jgi:Domain of unknown function (DUF4372)